MLMREPRRIAMRWIGDARQRSDVAGVVVQRVAVEAAEGANREGYENLRGVEPPSLVGSNLRPFSPTLVEGAGPLACSP